MGEEWSLQYYYHPMAILCSLGYGPGNRSFPLEHYLIFETTKLNGSHITYEWTWGDDTNDEVYLQDYHEHKFPDNSRLYILLQTSSLTKLCTVPKVIGYPADLSVLLHTLYLPLHL